MTRTWVRRVVAAAAAAGLCGVLVSAQGQPGADEMLQRARTRSTVEGKLDEAIALYAEVAATFAGDRPVAVRAPIEMAGCYEKLGQARAREIYERIARDFADQKEIAAQARARLAGLARPASGASSRQVWAGEKVDGQGSVSPDGKYVAYTSTRSRAAGDKVLVIRETATGASSELRPNLRAFNWPRWAPDGRSFVCQGTDADGRQGIFRIDRETGAVTSVAASEPGRPMQGPQFSPDGRVVFFALGGSVYERDLSSGTVRELVSVGAAVPRALTPDGRSLLGGAFSPDSRYVAVFELQAPSPQSAGPSTGVSLVAVGGGAPRALIRVDGTDGLVTPGFGWLPDGRGLVVPRAFEAGKRPELWVVPIDGARPRAIALRFGEFESLEGIRIHPDGKRLAWVGGKTVREVVALEHFLPTSKTR